MNEVEFRNWLAQQQVQKKVQSDLISRLKRIEKEIENCDIDEQYRSDRCEYLLSLFRKMGLNQQMQQHPQVHLPVGTYSMNDFRYALRYYIRFCDDGQASSRRKA